MRKTLTRNNGYLHEKENDSQEYTAKCLKGGHVMVALVCLAFALLLILNPTLFCTYV